MKYALLIYHDEQAWERSSEAEKAECYAQHGRLHEALNAKGAWLGGEELKPTATATTLRKNGSGEVLLSDGPFAETAEHLGGFYLIEAADLDEAIAYARMLPEGTVEIRPVMPH